MFLLLGESFHDFVLTVSHRLQTFNLDGADVSHLCSVVHLDRVFHLLIVLEILLRKPFDFLQRADKT